MPPTEHGRGSGLLMLAGLALAWGVNWPIMKVALQEIPLFQFRALNAICAGLLLLALARLSGQSLKIARRHWPPLLIAAVCYVSLWFLGSSYGVTRMPAGYAVIIAFTMPMWTVLLSVLVLGERATVRRLAALALGIGGVVTLMSANLKPGAFDLAGGAATLGAAMVWATGTVALKRRPLDMPMLSLVGWQFLLGGIPLVIVALLAQPVVVDGVSALAWGGVVYTIVLGSVCGYYLWFRIIGLLSASVAAISVLATPAIGVISGALLLGEPFGPREILALLLVGTGVSLVVFQRRVPPPPT